jgi:hypothetical protein
MPDDVEQPIDMLLFCPRCGQQHVDQPDPADGWDNPPHTSHKCVGPNGCGCIWRPADVQTNGVRAIQTHGRADTWPATTSEAMGESFMARTPSPVSVEEVARAIWREDYYDAKLCSHNGDGIDGCAYCEPHDDDTPDDWPADKERVERQARAAIAALSTRP